MNYTIFRDGVIVGHLSCSPKQLANNLPIGCEVVEGRIEVEQSANLDEQVRLLALEQIARLDQQKVRALTDHVLSPSVEIDVSGRKMLPKDRVAELEAAIAEQRKRL